MTKSNHCNMANKDPAYSPILNHTFDHERSLCTGSPIYDNDDPLDPETNTIRGDFLDEFVAPDEATSALGAEYRSTYYEPAIIEAIVRRKLGAPMIDLEIAFWPFEIGSDVASADQCNEILLDVYAMSERFDVAIESAELPSDEWSEAPLDETLLARHIPLVRKLDGGFLFHAQHLYQLIGHLGKIPGAARFFQAASRELVQYYHPAAAYLNAAASCPSQSNRLTR